MQDPYSRTKESYENEINQLRTDLRDAVELLNEYTNIIRTWEHPSESRLRNRVLSLKNRPSVRETLGMGGEEKE